MSKRPSQRSELISALQQSVRRFSDEVNLYEASVAERLGMHATDLQYLSFVELYGPTTAGHLAELGGLTTGAVTGVVDRLEKAGYVRRETDPADRRKVVIGLLPGAAERVGALHQPMLPSTDHLWDRYSDDELALILEDGTHLGLVRDRQALERGPRQIPSIEHRSDFDSRGRCCRAGPEHEHRQRDREEVQPLEIGHFAPRDGRHTNG